MNLSDLTLRDIEYVLAVARTQHFSQAAEACAVSQPALSTQIQRLERQLGVTLFERSKRHVRLSGHGERLLPQMERLWHEAKQLLELAESTGGVLSGVFRLGLIATAGPYVMPWVLRPLHQQFTNLKLILREGHTHSLLTELSDGKLDAVLAALPLELTPKLSQKPVYFEPFMLALPKGHPFGLRPAVDVTWLKPDELLLLEEGNCLSDQTRALCPERNSERKNRLQQPDTLRYQATSIETLLQMVAAGLGYAVIPALALPLNPQLAELIDIVGFNKPYIGRQMTLVWRTHSYVGESIEALAELMAKTLNFL